MTYKNVVYVDNKIHLWEIHKGKTRKIVENYLPEFYIYDPNNRTALKDIYGKSVIKRVAKNGFELMKISKAPTKTCESDLPIESKYLQKRYKDSELKVKLPEYTIGIIDIELAVEGAHTTALEVAHPVNLITLILLKGGKERIVTFGLGEYLPESTEDELLKDNCEYYSFDSEEKLLKSFVMFFRRSRIDILTGYNLVGFDIPYTVNRIKKLFKMDHKKRKLEEFLSPVNALKYNEKNNEYTIKGITVMDYMLMIKKFTFKTLPSYSLDYVSNHFLKKNKISFEGSIKDIWKTDWNLFVRYNIQDCKLLVELDEKLKFIELAIHRCYDALTPLENYHSPIHIWTGVILKYLHQHNMVLPNKPKDVKDTWKKLKFYKTREGELQNCLEGEDTFKDFFIKGGHVEAYPNMYFKVLSFDAKGLYPSNIIFYNISPETKVFNPQNKEGLIKSPINGVYYKKQKGILPILTEISVNERDEFKEQSFKYFNEGDMDLYSYYNNRQMVKKINNNSLYGALCNIHFHLFDVDNARAITRGGRNVIKYIAKYINKYLKEHLHKEFHKYFPRATNARPLTRDVVTLIDTDSNYITMEEVYEVYGEGRDFLEFALEVEEKLLQPLIDKLIKRFANVHYTDGFIYFKREGIISKQIVFAKKKYSTLKLQNEDKIYKTPEMENIGLETQRSSFPKFCVQSVKDSLNKIFEEVHCSEDLKKPHIKEYIEDSIRETRKRFMASPIEDISIVSSVQKFAEKCYSGEWYMKNGFVFPSSLPIYYRASCVYNYVVAKHKLPYIQVTGGDKIKYIYVKESNETRNNVVAYIGNYPKEFESIFQIDYEEQFRKTYFGVMERLFEVLGWGKIEVHKNPFKKLKRKL